MKLIVKYHGDLAEYFPGSTEEKMASVSIGADDSIISVMEKFCIPSEIINFILVNGIKVDKDDFEKHRFSDGDILAVWPMNSKE
jgi:hypothetical protein